MTNERVTSGSSPAHLMNRVALVQPTAAQPALSPSWLIAITRAGIGLMSVLGTLVALLHVTLSVPGTGGQIIYTGNQGGRQGLYMLDVLSGESYRIPHQEQRDTEAAWSPDGSQLVLVSQSGTYCNRGIFVMDSDGNNRRRLTGCYSDALHPAWSPDGSQIAFVAFRRNTTDLYVINPDGNNLQNITADIAVENSPSWSPDGSRITFGTSRDGNWEIYLIGSDGSNRTRLTYHEAADWDPAWSPDGSQIVFVSNRSGVSFELYTMNPDGSNIRKLTHTGSEDQNPSWSSDSRQVAFVSRREGPLALYLVDVHTSVVYRLSNAGTQIVHPTWHP